MVNLCYDVSVKLFSINLLLAAVFLAGPDFTKLARFFVLNRPMEPAEASGPTFHRRWLATTVVAFKLLFITANLYQSGSYWYERYQSQMAHPPRPALYGLYDVEAFIQNGHERLALTTDPTRWRRVIIDFFPPKVMQVQMMDDSFRPYQVEYDKAGESVTVISGTENSKKYRLECSRPDADHLVMQGMLASDSMTVRMKRMDPSKFFLLGRGFEWIQEAPVSR